MIKLNKIISILLCLSMIFTTLPYSVYGESDINLVCSECSMVNGHIEGCSLSEKEVIKEEDIVIDDDIIKDDDINCTCNSIYHIHDDTCPLYVEIKDENVNNENTECTCNSEVHLEDCPLFVNEEIEEEPIIECTCNSEVHLEDCPLFEDEEPIIECTCGLEIHSTDCALYEVIWSFEKLLEIIDLSELYNLICEDESIVEDLSNDEKVYLIERIEELYNSIEEPTDLDTQMRDYLVNLLNSFIIEICELCGLSEGHLESCSFYLCEECNSKEHLEDCSKYIIITEEIFCEECLTTSDKHLESCSQYKGNIENIEENKCSECESLNGEHLENCSQYIEKCVECKGIDENHLETCSQYVVICAECSEKDNKHLTTCPFYEDNRTIYEKLLDSSFEEMYFILLDAENEEELENLSELEIDELIYQVSYLSNDEDKEIELLMFLYSLPNAPESPWQTLEDGYIYFDIAYGDVTFTDTTYSGYNSEGVLIEGEHLESNFYYIEQSNSKTNYTVSVGTVETPVTLDFEIHLCGVNIDAPKTSEYHKPAVYVNTDSGYVYLVLDNNTTNTLVSYGLIFNNGSNSGLRTEKNRFGHAAIEKEIDTKGILVITCEEGLVAHKNTTSGHDCSPNSVCGVLNAYSKGEAGFKSGTTRTSAAAAIGSKAEVSDVSDKRTSLTGAPTMGTLYNLRIAGGVITATGSTGNYNSNTALGGSPGIGVGAGFQQYSVGYSTASFRIYGGYINAIAGDGSSACIGGGYHAGEVNVTIYGGTIFATDKLTASTDIKRGAGIGGGGGGSTSNATAGANVYIRGGTIYAHSEFGAAIGSGAGGNDGIGQTAKVDIAGGEIYANTTKSTGNGAGAAIGSGGSTGIGKGGKATVLISGGEIYASSELGADIGGGGTNSTNTAGVGGEAVITISNGYIEAMNGGIGGGNANAGVGGKATLTITGGTINASSINGGDSITNNGGSAIVKISNGLLNTGSIGGGRTSSSTAQIGSAAVEIIGGEIHGQVIMDSTNIVSGESCYFKMSGGNINMETPNNGFDFSFYQENGAVVYIIGGADSSEPIAQLLGGTIENGSAKNGGAIYITGGGSMLMSGGTIKNCTAKYNGGAVSIDGGDFEMIGGSIIGCIANNGGAIYVNGGNILMGDGLLEYNTAIENGGAIFVESETIDVNINIEGGNIMNNSAGNNAGAIGANMLGTSKCYIAVGLETCKCENLSLHLAGVCPKIYNNTAEISGGAFYCQSIGNSESTDIEDHILFVDLYCSDIRGNIATKYNGSNSLHEENGYFTIYAGEIDDGFLVDGGVFRDLRPKSQKQIVRFWSNYADGSTVPYEMELTVGYTMYLPDDTYSREGHLLSGWARVSDGSTGFIPIGGEYTVENLEDGEYVDFYAIWDSQISFIIYIPESLEINQYTGEGEMEISAELNYFNENSLIEIFVNSDFLLYLSSDNSVVLPYELTTSEPGIVGTISDGGLVATFEYNNIVSKTLTVKLKKWAEELGTYFGSLTFTINFESGE